MNLRDCLCSIALCTLSVAPALATEVATEQPAPQPSPVAAQPSVGGVTTQHWLALQRSRAQASPHPQALSGPVQQQIHERYLKSFSHEIKERMQQDSASSTK